MNDKQRVLVTGASGFVASHIIKQLLERGYLVTGTVRSLSNSSKVEFLRRLPNSDNLELVEADLLKEGSFDNAVKGCIGVFHTASPVLFSVEDPYKQLVEPAVKGTQDVFQACIRTDTVKCVVITSSVAAVYQSPINQYTYSEKDWNSVSSPTGDPYRYSKTAAEKAAWEIAGQNRDKFKVVVVNPSYATGPPLNAPASDKDINASNEVVITSYLTGKFKDLPHHDGFGIVDVRDVALAHILAFEKSLTEFLASEDRDGKLIEDRYLCVSEPCNCKRVVDILRKHFGDSYTLPQTSDLDETSFATPGFDTSKIRQRLGFKCQYSAEQTVKDTVEFFIAHGLLDKTKASSK